VKIFTYDSRNQLFF